MPKHSSATSKRARPAALTREQRVMIEKVCADAGERLTSARLGAYADLVAHGKPISAYELLALMEQREKRKLAPLTAYRQLEFLMRLGLVHRLASEQTFMACEHPDHPHEGLYLLCSSCGKADELESPSLVLLLGKVARSRGFRAKTRVVEVRGLCKSCDDGDQA